MSIIPKIFKNAVVPIGITLTDGTIKWIGTGFFVVRHVKQDKLCLFLITNRHVFIGKSGVKISMKELNTEKMKIVDASLTQNGNPLYFLHPNTNIDIAVLPLNPDFIESNNLEFPAFDIDENGMTSLELRENGADEGSLVYMLGYTLGLVNENSHYPICRLGCIARISEAQIKEEFNILVDIQNFQGNSGSPIILRPDIISLKGTKHVDKCVLVGIVHSYILFEDTLRSSATDRVVEVRSENSGIAQAHPVEFIREIIDKIAPKVS